MATFTKEIMEQALHAVQDFRVRCLMDAKDEILATGRYNEAEIDKMILTLFDEERKKYLLYREIRGHDQMAFDPLKSLASSAGISDLDLLRHLYELDREGLIRVIEEEGKVVSAQCLVKNPADIKSVYVPVTEFSKPFCAGCGLCQGICPVDCITVTNGVLEIDDKKCIHCGLCFSVCPRAFLPKKVVNWAVNLDVALPADLSIGSYIEAYSGHITDEAMRSLVQDGGVVSGLLIYAFQNNLIDAALGARMSSTPWLPEPFIMTSPEDVRQTAGTKYANNPTLQKLPEIREFQKVAVVGTPCMMQALQKSQVYSFGNDLIEKVKYKIGIFCMESFSYDSILEIAKILETDVSDIKKMDINKGKFFVYTKTGDVKEVAIKEITHLARHECHFCYDLTSENADISVGSIGSPSGWSTILVRNQKGKELLDGAIQSGLIEVKPIEEVKPGIDMVKKIAGFKNGGYNRAKNKAQENQKPVPGYY